MSHIRIPPPPLLSYRPWAGHYLPRDTASLHRLADLELACGRHVSAERLTDLAIARTEEAP